MVESGLKRLFSHAAACERKTLDEWRAHYHRADDLELALNSHCRHIETTISRKPGGLVSVTIAVLDSKPSNCWVAYYSLQRVGNSLYEVKESTSSRS